MAVCRSESGRSYDALQTAGSDPGCSLTRGSMSSSPWCACRRAAASVFTGMTAPHPVASKSPGSTGVRCTGLCAPSQYEMVTGPGFSSPNQLDKDPATADRAGAGPYSWADAQCATIVGNWRERSIGHLFTETADDGDSQYDHPNHYR